jgi:hypothetical protein
LSEIAAINFQRLTVPAKAFVYRKEKERKAAQLYPKNNRGGKLFKIQGPWAGQDIDPVDLKGPAAIPMPVTIGRFSDFEPIFWLLAQNTTIDEGDETGSLGLETTWNNPILEFNRSIVYEDSRLNLCKKVVGLHPHWEIDGIVGVRPPNQAVPLRQQSNFHHRCQEDCRLYPQVS